jgi:lipoteichoic acid synthase
MISRTSKIYTLVYKLKEIMIEFLDVIIIATFIIAKNLHYGKLIAPDYYNMHALLTPVAFSILPLVGIFFLFKEEKRVKALFIFDLIISLVLFADTAYFRYFKDITSIGSVRNGALLGSVISCLPSLIKFNDITYFVDLIVLLPLVKIFADYKKRKKFKLNGAFRFILFLLVFSTGVMVNGKCISKFNTEQPLLLTTMSNKLFLTKVLGNFNYHAVDIYDYTINTIESKKPISVATKQNIKNYLQDNKITNSGAVLKGVGEGKNLIVIQVEALQQFVINKTVNGQEITPNLNKWLNKSLYFDNYYYQVAAGNTSDAEFMSNNSLYPSSTGSAYYKYSGDKLDSLPTELKSSGYSTAALHGYIESFYNRNIMYQTEGFDNFYGQSSFSADETVGLGLSDKSFLKQSEVKIQAMKQPYYSFLVTLSSHYPFDDQKGYGGDFNVGEYEGTLMGDYLKAIHYTDQQLGMFLDDMEKNGTLDNSIVVIYGDHNAIPKEYASQLYSFEGITNPTDLDWQQLQKVPMIIHFPGNANSGVNHTYSGQMDLYPTLANIFNLNPSYTFGKDMLNSSSQKVVFRNGSFTDGKTFYISWTDQYYNISTGQTIAETDEMKAEKEQAMQEMSLSDNLLDHNLIKTGLGE